MDLFNNYFKLQEEIFNYFGFVEDWKVFPLDDRRNFEWVIVGDNEVKYGKKFDIINYTGEYYSNEIYKQRFYSKWIYRAKDYTMIMVDTCCDDNKFLAIFDNSKEFKEDEIIE